MSERSMIRWCGLAGIVGSVLLIAGDLALGGWVPMSGRELGDMSVEGFVRSGFEAYNGKTGLMLVGAWAGPIAACFFVIGFAQVWFALRPAGTLLAGTTFSSFAVFAISAGAFHASYAFLAVGVFAEQAGATDPAIVWDYLTRVLVTFLFATATPLAVGSLAFAYAVAFRPTLYPRWMVLFTPLLLVMTRDVTFWVPAPLGGPLYATHFNICLLVFFAVSTLALSPRASTSPPG